VLENINFAAGGLPTVLILGFLMGLRHAADADHIVAVSTIMRRERSIPSGIWIGISWGLGHSTPLIILGVLIMVLKEGALNRFVAISAGLEISVGIMLVVLGANALWKARRERLHAHDANYNDPSRLVIHAHVAANDETGADKIQRQHPTKKKVFFRLQSYLIGAVHGLAGTASIMLLLIPQISSVWIGILYLLLFSIGTMLSMAVFTIILGAPFQITNRFDAAHQWVTGIAGVLSIGLGGTLISDRVFHTHFIL